jgi:hypothetical protein
VVELHLIVWLAASVVNSICLKIQFVLNKMKMSNNRSVMPLDVLGGTRVTMKPSTCSLSERIGKSLNRLLSWDCGLKKFT